MSDSVK